MTTDPSSKRKLISHKDVQLTYLLNGTEAVAQQWQSGNVSRSTLRRAVSKLQQSSEDTSDLEKWVTQTLGPSGRGRAAPRVGETRSYKAQQIKAGSPFLRLPLDSLGATKGQDVQVEFKDGQIVVTAR